MEMNEYQRIVAGRKESDPQTKIVTICGSMRFFEQMLQVAADETVKGNIVLAPFSVIATADQGSDIDDVTTVAVPVYIDTMARAQWLADTYGRSIPDILTEAIERGLPEIGGAVTEPDSF